MFSRQGRTNFMQCIVPTHPTRPCHERALLYGAIYITNAASLVTLYATVFRMCTDSNLLKVKRKYAHKAKFTEFLIPDFTYSCTNLFSLLRFCKRCVIELEKTRQGLRFSSKRGNFKTVNKKTTKEIIYLDLLSESSYRA